jgi:hypothetical protein
MSPLDKTLLSSLEEFSKILSCVKEGKRQIPVSGGIFDDVEVTQLKIQKACSLITKHKSVTGLSKEIIDHFQQLSSYITVCSSPKAFRTAWGLRSKTLSIQDAEAIVNDGGQLIPVNSGSRIFSYEQQGVVLGPNKRLVFAVRHSEGNYDDSLDELGRFTYQPPKDVSGMLRYRWCQFLCDSLKVPFVLLVIMWFEFRLNSKLNHVFVIAPAKIIDYQSDLVDFNANFHKPLKLQLIPRHEALNSINLLNALDSQFDDIEIRAELPDSLAREWAYDKIATTEKGKKLKKWARLRDYCCPGSSCGGQRFSQFGVNELAFGHIVSQKWVSAFTFMLDKVHHPDNLYLTCRSCNSSLSNNFPEKDLRKNIEKYGTIGDWLRTAEAEIRKQ